MKKLAFLLVLTAHVALAIPGTYSFGLGPGNNMTNSNYATTFGSYAGGDATANTRTCLFGSVAGMDSRYVQKSVGIGYGALYNASNCTSCVAIGDTVGSRWRNANGWVQIGNAFAVTNGFADIKAPNGAHVGPLRLGADAYDQDHDLKGNLIVSSEYNPTSSTRTGGRIYAGDYIEAPQGYFAQAQVGEISFISSAVMIDTDDANRLCVYTNGVLAGYLTITPPAQGQ